MGLLQCVDCGGQVSSAAPSCPHCGRPMAVAAPPLPPPAIVAEPQAASPSIGQRLLRRVTRAMKLLVLAVLGVIAFLIFIAYKAQGPRGEAINLSAKEDVGLVNGEMDAGLRVKFEIKNNGDAGTLVVRPWLACSDGQWERVQRHDFDTGQTIPFEFFFHEPTVNATQIQYGVKLGRK